MSEALDRVRGVNELPLFPLPVILFPGAPLPLHIFEPRYQTMLKDIQAGNGLFGLSYFDAGESDESMPELEHLGCVAEVRDVQPLPDGRSNILAVGVIRYRLENYVDADEPYLVGKVSYFEDYEEDKTMLEPKAKQVQDLFVRIARAIKKLNNDNDPLPDFPPTEPDQLSFLVSSAMDIEPSLKLELLEMRLTSERLERLHSYLSRAVGEYEERAHVQQIAKTNGHTKKKIHL
jgi:Lon protease-like protein